MNNKGLKGGQGRAAQVLKALFFRKPSRSAFSAIRDSSLTQFDKANDLFVANAPRRVIDAGLVELQPVVSRFPVRQDADVILEHRNPAQGVEVSHR